MERDLVSRKRKRIVAVAVAVLVIAITATVTTVALYQHQEKSKVPLSHGELSDSLTSVPLDVYNQVGAGSASLQIQATGEKSDGSTKANFPNLDKAAVRESLSIAQNGQNSAPI